MSENGFAFSAIRRIVAGHDESGKAVVISDGPAKNYQHPGSRRSTLIWATSEVPADFFDLEDTGNWSLGVPPPEGGTIFRVIESAPGATYPALHRTDTIDYVICMKGQITMDLDDSTVVMNAGDVLIQLGTNHGWRNDTDESAIVAFVLVDGTPKASPKLPPPRLV